MSLSLISSTPPENDLDRQLRLSLIAGEISRLLREAGHLQGDRGADYSRMAETFVAWTSPDFLRAARIRLSRLVSEKIAAIGDDAVTVRWSDHSREEDFRELARTIAHDASRQIGDYALDYVMKAFLSTCGHPLLTYLEQLRGRCAACQERERGNP